MTDDAYIEAAREHAASVGGLEIDEGAEVSRGASPGAYVAAWLWVDSPDGKPSDQDPDDPEPEEMSQVTLLPQSFFVIDYKDFEELVKKTYGINEYSFVQTEEGRNDSTYRFSVEKNDACPRGRDAADLADLEAIKAGAVPQYSNHVIFQDLVDRGVLAHGQYLVEVCW